MSQMNTLQVNTVYTERKCVYVRVRCNLLEEEHTHPDLHATILRYEQPSCCRQNKCITHVNCVGPFSNISGSFCMV